MGLCGMLPRPNSLDLMNLCMKNTPHMIHGGVIVSTCIKALLVDHGKGLAVASALPLRRLRGTQRGGLCSHAASTSGVRHGGGAQIFCKAEKELNRRTMKDPKQFLKENDSKRSFFLTQISMILVLPGEALRALLY